MAAATATPSDEQVHKVALKVLVDKEKNKVLFAEARKDFVDALSLEFVDSISETANSKGYVKGPIMYMATDDLVVTLMSSISVISLLSSVCIHVNDLEEKVVNIGINVGVLILQASLTSTSVLSVGLGHLLTPR
ncbi:hypothetical protein JHK85_018981 [Glycine max]|nr:hypothetical protein JHK85_018981 [Glycine max]